MAGTFLGGRQANISKFFFKKIEKKEIVSYEGLTDSKIKTKENIDIEIYEIPQDYEIKSNYSDGLIKFEKEPENEYDKNAIRVMIKGMGTVGYVPKNINISFAKILENNDIKEITATICGGEYKLWNGKKLKNDRDELKLSLRDLSSKTGISSSTLQRYETMETYMPIDKFQIICDVLGLEADKLLSNKNYSSQEKENNIFSQLTDEELAKLEKFNNMSTVMFMNEGNDISGKDKETLAIAYAEVLISQRKK